MELAERKTMDLTRAETGTDTQVIGLVYGRRPCFDLLKNRLRPFEDKEGCGKRYR